MGILCVSAIIVELLFYKVSISNISIWNKISLLGKPATNKSSTSIFDICWQGEIADDT